MNQKQLMPSLVQVTIHHSQFPEAVRRELLKSLHTRRVNHKFHYDSIKQAQKWLHVHKAYSPWHNDPGCRAVYRLAFKQTAPQIRAKTVHVIGLGCGTGQKDLQLIRLLSANDKAVCYTPCDSSVPMVLMAYRAALAAVTTGCCKPVVCDLAIADDLAELLEKVCARHRATCPQRRRGHTITRLVTFFGLLPNFHPMQALRQMRSLLRRGDFLLLSANLVPGADMAAGMKKVLSQYDNTLTRDWLMTFLLDLGVECDAGTLRFDVEHGQFGVNRVVAKFHFKQKSTVQIWRQTFVFRPPDTIQLFFSYRYTPKQLHDLLQQYGFTVTGQWLTPSGDEGVFCCSRT